MSIHTFSAVAVAHPAHQLKVAVRLGDELSVEGPGEGDVQHGVAGHLTRQHDALAHNDLHVHWPLGDSGRICLEEEAEREREREGKRRENHSGGSRFSRQSPSTQRSGSRVDFMGTSKDVSWIRRRKQRLCTDCKAVFASRAAAATSIRVITGLLQSLHPTIVSVPQLLLPSMSTVTVGPILPMSSSVSLCFCRNMLRDE